jgi:Holliday junction resolvase RusA-like endonuclease
MTRFTVYGVPAPQGSKTRMPNGALVESASTTGRLKVRAWRTAVTEVARDHRPEAPLDGPLWLAIEFRMPRPKARRRAFWADRKPDASKLLRATEDALKDAGIVLDDSRFCRITIEKLYADPIDPWTGAVVSVTPLCEMH